MTNEEIYDIICTYILENAETYEKDTLFQLLELHLDNGTIRENFKHIAKALSYTNSIGICSAHRLI